MIEKLNLSLDYIYHGNGRCLVRHFLRTGSIIANQTKTKKNANLAAAGHHWHNGSHFYFPGDGLLGIGQLCATLCGAQLL